MHRLERQPHTAQKRPIQGLRRTRHASWDITCQPCNISSTHIRQAIPGKPIRRQPHLSELIRATAPRRSIRLNQFTTPTLLTSMSNIPNPSSWVISFNLVSPKPSNSDPPVGTQRRLCHHPRLSSTMYRVHLPNGHRWQCSMASRRTSSRAINRAINLLASHSRRAVSLTTARDLHDFLIVPSRLHRHRQNTLHRHPS